MTIDDNKYRENATASMPRRAIEEARSAGLSLLPGPDGMSLTDGRMTVRDDFAHMIPRLKASNLNREILVKAARIRGQRDRLTAVDATAGLGEDSLLLAAAGFEVLMFERNPVIATLLRDALERAAAMPELEAIVARMTLVEADSVTALHSLDEEPDVVLLDPMFPAKRKDAAVKKKLQLLQRLELPCDDESALFDAALAANPRKVIVKRPVKGPYLAGRAPSYSLSGKAVRYDCIALAR